VYVYECEGLHCDVFDPVPHTRLERELYNQLLLSPSRVRHIEDADAAYFPVNMVSWYYNNTDGSMPLVTYASYKSRNAELEEAWAKWSERLPPPEVRSRIPHFIIWPYVFYNVNISFVPQDIFVLAYENIGVGGAPAHASYENGCAQRCIIIPYFSSSEDIDPPRYEQYKSRKLVSFVGSVVRSSATRSFRSRIVSYLRESLSSDDFIFKSTGDGLPPVVENWEDLDPEKVNHSLAFKMSKLCLELPGDTVTRKGFYDAIRHGCSPVILASSLKLYQRLLGGALPISEAVVTLPDDLATHGVPLDGVVEKLRSAALNEAEARRRLQAISRIQPFLSYNTHEESPLSLPLASAIKHLVGRARHDAHAREFASRGGDAKDHKASTREAEFHSAPASGTTSLGFLQARKKFLFRQKCTGAKLADGTSCRVEGACFSPPTGRWFANVEAPATVLLRPKWSEKYKSKSLLTLNPVSAAAADEARLMSESLAIFVPGITVLARRYAVGNFGHAMLENVFPLLKVLSDLDMDPSNVERVILDDDCEDATDHELLFGYPNNVRNCAGYMQFLVNMLLPNVDLHEKDFFAHGRPVCFETLALGVGHKSSLDSWAPAVRDSALEATTSMHARRAIERYIHSRAWKPPTQPSPRFIIHEKALGNRHGASIINAQDLCSELTKHGASCQVFSLDKFSSLEGQVKLVHEADVFVSDPGSSQYYSIFLRPGARHITFEKCLVPDGTLRKVCSESGKFDLANNLNQIEKAHGKIFCEPLLPGVLESFGHINRTCLQARPDLIRSMSYHNCAPSTEWSKAWFSQEEHTHGLNVKIPPQLLLAEMKI